jgi:DNA-binding beta-propeller fold protein YncE
MIASERLVFLSVPPKWRVVAIFTLTVIFFLPTHGAAQTNWPMPGHDAQHTGRANFAGPISAPTAPSWTFSTASPIVGDIVTSVEGTLYFASDQLYALKPDGTAFAPSVSIGVPATGPVVDDASGLIYIAAAAADGGFDLLRLTKQLQSAAVVLHVPRPPNGAIISPLVLGRGGLVFFVAGRFPGVVYAAGPVQWSNPACPAEAGPNTPFGASANGPVVSPDGSSLFVMCGGGTGGQDGLLRLQAGTGVVAASTPTNRNSTEAALDSLQHLRSGWQAFGGAVFCGDYLTWDFSLTLLTTPAAACDSSRFTTSRAAIMPDGQSTVRIGFAFPPDNQLDAEGINNWIISTDGSTVSNFSSLPAVDAAGNVFIGNTQGIEALSPIDGHRLWSFTTGNQITTQPVIANGGALYVGSSSGKVYAFNTTPAHQSGTVYVSGSGAGFATVDLLSAAVTATNNTFTDGGVIAVSPDRARSYVSAIFGLAVVDNTTNQVITTVSVGSRPEWVALSPDGSRVYVSQPNISSVPGVLQGVYVIDAATNAIIAGIPIPGPQRVAVAPDNSRVYVGSGGRGIAVIDPITNTVVRSVDILGAQTTGIAFTPDGAHAYVGEINGPSVYLIDARADALLQTIPLSGSLGGGVSGVVASPDGSKVYAGNVRNGPFVTAPRDVFVINTTTNAVAGQIPVSFPSPQLAISSDGANLLVGDSDIGNLIVTSLATNSVVASIHVNDPCCPNITGIGAAPPAAVVQPPTGRLVATTALNFGVVQQGTTSTLSIQLQNVGMGPLIVTGMTLDNPAFNLSAAPQLPLSIPAGTSILLSLNFSPLTLGTFNGSLSITSTARAEPTTVTLTGVAVAPPILNVQPLSVDFGLTSTAETRQTAVTISNMGGSTLSGTASIDAPNLNAFSLSSSSFSVAPGQSLNLLVAFSPSDRISYTGSLLLASNGGQSVLPISGTGESVAVLTVVGLGGDSTTFGLLPDFLTSDNNLRVFSFVSNAGFISNGSPASCLPKDVPRIERIAGELSDCINDILAGRDPLGGISPGFDRVDIVAHSMGGLESRALIAGLALSAQSQPISYNGQIRKLIMVGTPNYGVPADEAILGSRLGQLLGAIANPDQVKELTAGSDFLVELDRRWHVNVAPEHRIDPSDMLVIVGTASVDGDEYTHLPDDEAVPNSSATLPCEFLPCSDLPRTDHVRYVPYKHADFLPGNVSAEVNVDSENHKTLALIRDFILERPLEITFAAPPLPYTSDSLLLLQIVDQSGISVHDLANATVVLDGDDTSLPQVFRTINVSTGTITVWPVRSGLRTITLHLKSKKFSDPIPFPLQVIGGRPTLKTVMLHR